VREELSLVVLESEVLVLELELELGLPGPGGVPSAAGGCVVVAAWRSGGVAAAETGCAGVAVCRLGGSGVVPIAGAGRGGRHWSAKSAARAAMRKPR